MDMGYPTIEEAATPEYVLAVLCDMHRQQCQYDPEADTDAVLKFESTVAEWRAACDLLDWRELGRAHNQIRGITCSDTEWRGVLEPPGRQQVAGVCRLIAEHANRPCIRPARVLGCICRRAGAFLTIRSLLHAAGAPAGEIAPSTRLASYARLYGGVFLGPVSRISPGALPPVRIRTPVYDSAVWGLVAALGCIMVGVFPGFHVLIIIGVGLFALSYALTWYSARCLLPASVEFGGLQTFRDLAIVVAGGSPDAAPDRRGV